MRTEALTSRFTLHQLILARRDVFNIHKQMHYSLAHTERHMLSMWELYNIVQPG